MTRLATKVYATDTELEVDGPLTAALPYRIVVDEEPMLVTGVSGMRWVVRRGMAGDPVDHDADTVIERAYDLYGTAANAGLSAGGAHPGLVSHESLGLAAEHDHPYAAESHSHAGGDHPDAAAHEQMGLAADDHSHPAPDLTHDHDADYAAIHAHPYAADDHSHPGGTGEHPDLAAHETLGLAAEVHAHDEYATDSDLTTHAGTAHGLSAHAIDGAYHTGTEVLPTQGQKNALAGTSGTPGASNQYVTHQDARLSDERTPTAHTHDYAATSHAHVDADIPAAIARDAEVTSAIATHAATPHGGDSGEVYAVGDLYLTLTNHANAAAVATRHGYGTWARFGVGRFLLLTDGTAGTEGGSATHSHSFTQPDAHTQVINHTHPVSVTDPGHVHDEYNNTATTGPNVGWGAQDTSTNSASLTGYDTGSATTGITASTSNPAGGVASLTHANGAVADGSTDPLSITAYAWQRTA